MNILPLTALPWINEKRLFTDCYTIGSVQMPASRPDSVIHPKSCEIQLQGGAILFSERVISSVGTTATPEVDFYDPRNGDPGGATATVGSHPGGEYKVPEEYHHSAHRCRLSKGQKVIGDATS